MRGILNAENLSQINVAVQAAKRWKTNVGYFSLKELQEVRGPFGLPIERDLYFEPKSLRELNEKISAGVGRKMTVYTDLPPIIKVVIFLNTFTREYKIAMDHDNMRLRAHPVT